MGGWLDSPLFHGHNQSPAKARFRARNPAARTKMTIYKSVAISRIYLDPANPRHDPINNEREIIAHLLKTEDIRPLAKSISLLGSTSPIELLALAPHSTAKNRFNTAEGNRRICALKLLADPDKAPTERDRKYFRGLQNELVKPIKSVMSVIFDDMDATRPWVSLRHEGEQGGVGAKSWNTRQSTRFNLLGNGKNPNALALHLVDYSTRKRLLTPDELNQLSLTTLTRYLSNPVVRSALGLANNRALSITVPVDEFDRVLAKFLRDSLGTGAVVTSRTSAPERKAYGEQLGTSESAPKTRGLDPFTPDSSETVVPPEAPAAAKTSIGTAPTKTQRNVRNRELDRYVVPSGFVSKIDDPIFQRLFLELRTLDAERFSFAATYLLRAVLEQATALFLRKHGIAPPKEMHLKLAKAAEKLQAQGYAGKGLAALRKMSSDVDSRYSPDTIGLFVHGGAIPTRVYAIKTWDTFEPILVEMTRQLT